MTISSTFQEFCKSLYCYGVFLKGIFLEKIYLEKNVFFGIFIFNMH